MQKCVNKCKSCRSCQEASTENLVSFGNIIYLQTSAPIQPRTGLLKFAKHYPKVKKKVGTNIGTCTDGYCDKGPCLSDDGHGCYHIFTETADIFEYELWTCTQQTVFASGLGTPSGIAIGGGYVFVGDYATGKAHVFEMDGKFREVLNLTSAGLAGLDVTCSDQCTLHFVNMLTNELGRLHFDPSTRRAYTWSGPDSCNALAASYDRPRFNVTHGPGYQNSMVIPHSYGKNCTDLTPGAPVDKTAALLCPDRTDCDNVNNDALLMSGYLCHPCLPDICSVDEYCVNIPYKGMTCASRTPLNAAPAEIIGRAADGLAGPADVATHPATGEVWIANRWSHDVAVGASTADGSMEFRVWRDRAPYHYMASVSALAFDDVGLVVTTCQDSRNEYWGKMDPNLFMGPSLYEAYPCRGERPARPSAAPS